MNAMFGESDSIPSVMRNVSENNLAMKNVSENERC
jgi:hypothetical protein